MQLVSEFTVMLTLIVQLPDGCGPKVMPPFSENRTGYARALFCRVNPVLTVTFGLPLNVMLETAQFVGVTVSVELSVPLPLLSSVNMKSPVMAIVPPWGHPL